MDVKKLIREAIEKVVEDAPAVSAGSGAVAGIGVGKDGEPGKKRKKKWSLQSS